MRHSLKGKTFTCDTDKEYVRKSGVKYEYNDSPTATTIHPIVTEERVIAAINLLKKVRNEK